MTDNPILESQWYWDRRNRKAYFPRKRSDGDVEFVTVWHVEEVMDALESDALVPLDEVKLDKTSSTFTLLESFRTPPHLEAHTNADGLDSNSGAHE